MKHVRAPVWFCLRTNKLKIKTKVARVLKKYVVLKQDKVQIANVI